MRMSRVLAVLFLVVGMAHCARLQAQTDGDGKVSTGVKLSDPTKTLIDQTTGTYRIDAKGKVSLGKGDTWTSFIMEFKEPGGKTPAPETVLFNTPATGESKDFHYRMETTKQGLWTITAIERYFTAGGAPDSKVDTKSISLP